MRERKVSLDVIRIVAVLAVIMIHTCVDFVTDYDTSSIEFIWGNILDSISRIGVPLFVMISGSLMLDENRAVKDKLFIKHIKNIVFLIVFWSVFYCMIYHGIIPLMRGENINVKKMIYSIIMGHYHMWYLYMLIGLYLITPFLREFVKVSHIQLVIWFITISLVTQFTLPLVKSLSLQWGILDCFSQFIYKFYLGFFGGYIVYYLMGWYIVHIGIKKKRLLYGLGTLALVITIIYVQITKDYSNAYSEQNILIFLYSTAVFTFFNEKFKGKIATKRENILIILSNLSFGVYIIHPVLQSIVFKVFRYVENPFLYILCNFGLITILSFAGCFIISKIPFIKKTIRM